MSTTTIDTGRLLADLQRLVQYLKADLLERLREVPEVDAGLRAAHQAIAERRPHGAGVRGLARRLPRTGGGGLGAGLRLRALPGGQRPDRRDLPGRARATAAARPRTRTRATSAPTRATATATTCSTSSAGSARSRRRRDLFAEGKTPLWAVGPSGDGAARLLAFWREIDPETGGLRRSFRVEGGDTRFLGDLYQDLSEAARKKYALLQTPEFVEEFILDRTLTPALDEFGLEAVRLIDPTCGSGHFLLGAFRRLFDLWSRARAGDRAGRAGAAGARRGVRRRPEPVRGGDRAVPAARRGAARCAASRRLTGRPGWHDQRRLRRQPAARRHASTGRGFRQRVAAERRAVVRPDLRHGGPGRAAARSSAGSTTPSSATRRTSRSRTRRSTSATGNRCDDLPPAVLARRAVHRAVLRPGPRRGDGHDRPGYVGMITANSFMKREFGKKLIEEFFPTVDLTHVIDTSGAYIPGHGTPTVILFGRNRQPVGDEVRAVLGIRGEPSTPDDPAQGLVWRSIVDHLDNGQVAERVRQRDERARGRRSASIRGASAVAVRRS